MSSPIRPAVAVLVTLFLGTATQAHGISPFTDTPSPAATPTSALIGASPAPVDLGTAGNFAILSKSGITDVPMSAVIGNVGTSPITGAGIGLTCAEVNGTIYAVDAAGPPPCSVQNATLLTTAVNDMETAYTNAAGRAPDFTEVGAGNIGGLVLAPGVYKWSTGVSIPADVTLWGGANDVWIFQIIVAGETSMRTTRGLPSVASRRSGNGGTTSVGGWTSRLGTAAAARRSQAPSAKFVADRDLGWFCITGPDGSPDAVRRYGFLLPTTTSTTPDTHARAPAMGGSGMRFVVSLVTWMGPKSTFFSLVV